MRNLSKVIILMAILSINHSLFAQPLNNNILIYNSTKNYWYASGMDSSWSISNSSSRGYVILDVSYDPNGSPSGINEIAVFDYYRSGSSKWYNESTPSSWDIKSIVGPNTPSGGPADWVLFQSNQGIGGGDLTMLRGDAKPSDIGNADPNEVAPVLNGNQLYYYTNGSDSLQFCDWSMRLQRNWTRMYNRQSMNMTSVRSRIRSDLERRGYSGGK